MSEFSNHIIIDNGSSSIKSGYNGEYVPRSVIPTVIGRTKNEKTNLIWTENKTSYGKNALINSTNMDLEYPIKNGKITNFEEIEKLWNYIFINELKTKPESHNVLLTESLFSSDSDRDKMAQIMYEKFSVFHICIEPQPLLSFHYSNKNSGLIIESGDSYTQVIPVFEKYIIPQGFKFNNISGNYFTENIREIYEKQLSRNNVANKYYVSKQIKEKFLEISPTDEFLRNLKSDLNLNFPLTARNINVYQEFLNKKMDIDPKENNTENNLNNKDNVHILPDGNKIDIGKELKITSEALFNPEIFNLEENSLQQMIFDSINSIDIHTRKDILNNLIIGGGSTLIKNFPERLKFECDKIFKENNNDFNMNNANVRIYNQPEREYSSWIGGSIYCSTGNTNNNHMYHKLSNSSSIWITKSDYEESGGRIFHRKYIF